MLRLATSEKSRFLIGSLTHTHSLSLHPHTLSHTLLHTNTHILYCTRSLHTPPSLLLVNSVIAKKANLNQTIIPETRDACLIFWPGEEYGYPDYSRVPMECVTKPAF